MNIPETQIADLIRVHVRKARFNYREARLLRRNGDFTNASWHQGRGGVHMITAKDLAGLLGRPRFVKAVHRRPSLSGECGTAILSKASLEAAHNTLHRLASKAA